jgi:hypothetical protein
MKWLVDVTVGVGDSEATLTVEVEAGSVSLACADAEDLVQEEMTIEAGNARPAED